MPAQPYIVVWDTDLVADDPREAAELAIRLMVATYLDKEPLTLYVTDTDGHETVVELGEDR